MASVLLYFRIIDNRYHIAPLLMTALALGNTACLAEKPAPVPAVVCVEGPLNHLTSGVATNAIGNVGFTITGLDAKYIIKNPSYVGVETTGKMIGEVVSRDRNTTVILPSDIIRFCLRVDDMNSPKSGGKAWMNKPPTPINDISDVPNEFKASALPNNTVYVTNEAGQRTDEVLEIKRPA